MCGLLSTEFEIFDEATSKKIQDEHQQDMADAAKAIGEERRGRTPMASMCSETTQYPCLCITARGALFRVQDGRAIVSPSLRGRLTPIPTAGGAADIFRVACCGHKVWSVFNDSIPTSFSGPPLFPSMTHVRILQAPEGWAS